MGENSPRCTPRSRPAGFPAPTLAHQQQRQSVGPRRLREWGFLYIYVPGKHSHHTALRVGLPDRSKVIIDIVPFLFVFLGWQMRLKVTFLLVRMCVALWFQPHHMPSLINDPLGQLGLGFAFSGFRAVVRFYYIDYRRSRCSSLKGHLWFWCYKNFFLIHLISCIVLTLLKKPFLLLRFLPLVVNQRMSHCNQSNTCITALESLHIDIVLFVGGGVFSSGNYLYFRGESLCQLHAMASIVPGMY